MKILNYILAVAMISATYSCIEEQETALGDNTCQELVPMRLNCVNDENHLINGVSTRTTYLNRTVLWEESDAISVFSNGNIKQRFTIASLSEDKTQAVFEGLGIPGSFIAIYPDMPSNTYDGTTLTVTVPSEQTASLNSFDSGANVSVAYSQDKTLIFKNVGALIGFRFTTQAEADKMTSVTIRAKSKDGSGYVGLSGSAEVTLNQENIPVADSGNTDHVKILAPEGGFTGGTSDTYFVSVYPFECSGFEVTMTTKDGKNIVLNSDSPASVARNTGLSINTLSTAHKLPDEFDVKIDFSKGWPFKEGIYRQDDQARTGSGDKYRLEYNFTIEEDSYSIDLDVRLFGGGATYTYHSSSSPHQLRTANANSRILLPGIEGRYLKSVKIEVNNAAPNNKATEIVDTGWNLRVEGPLANKTTPAVISFPCNYFFPEKGTSYYLRFPDKNLHLTTVTLTYSKELGIQNVQGENSGPKGHFSLMQMTNAGSLQMMGYILKTDSGKVIVIDGGNIGGDAVKLQEILRNRYGNKVHMWWITHPHSDHIGALGEILSDMQGLTIDYIMHSRFSEKHLNRESSQGVLAKEFYAKLDAAHKAKTTKVIGDVPLGAIYDIDGIHINILGVTNEEITTNAYNNSSMILRFEDKDKSVVFLGDAGEECGDKVLKKYSNQLDCDYLQMAHHGQKGVREEFYKTISFRACLWPTPKWLWEAVDGNANDWKTWQTRQWMDEKGITEHHVMWEDVDWYLE